MTRLKVMTILGTRPEIIRLSRVMARLDDYTDHTIVHTGQNYDYELNEVFFDDLGVRKPDHFLGVDTSSLGNVLGGVLIETEKLLKADRPDAVLILGDTNSAIATIMARRLKIPTYHMEAGNRSFDRNVPEETNRRLADHLADFNLCYTEHARHHLLSEGLPHRRTLVTGSPMREVLDHYRDRIEASDVLAREGLEAGNYYIVSLHREENVDDHARLKTLVDMLGQLAERDGYPVIVSTHPRTRNRLESMDGVDAHDLIRFMKPFGFHDYNHLQMKARCAISDSGTIAEEASMLDFAAITPRDSIERPEALDTGNVIVTGLKPETLLPAVDAAVQMRDERIAADAPFTLPDDYQVTNTSERVVKLILGTARLSNDWDGIRLHDHL
ncbi:non-hydrolyzing UDP-N-acetylglucosamine 2-epimerase [Sphingomicrobium sediminis]|uniref:UDP-N-acetylglucosamine 2-epimerase (Non-hydrolyzing) n=1 Tax=Sphingomicrobium sediminis TaxID=2950949 RepID=A0A9X2EJW4_9SPHN|nr:UDP-N-acetylglucosamine 2-epimerase (non-hydrolyzing) [Sphingomicrobium sediminis]MCM8556637.1 UDP-N-acetylglucosamine 2-epimerase (non-hydrolyzing) [Sphingomicrobium sediminis]